MAYISLTDEDIAMLDVWLAIERDNIPTLLHCISKLALIHHLDERYHLNPDEAKALLSLSDLLLHLQESKE